MKTKVKNIVLDDFWIMPQTPKYTEEGIPYITSKNIKNGIISFKNTKYISEKDFRKISKNRPIKPNDILISMIGTLGEAAIINESYGKFYGQNMFLIRLDSSKINYNYFLHYIKSTYVKNQLQKKQNKSTQSYLKAEHIEDLEIPVPNLEHQLKIENKISMVKRIINMKKEEVKKLDEIIKSQFVENATFKEMEVA